MIRDLQFLAARLAAFDPAHVAALWAALGRAWGGAA